MRKAIIIILLLPALCFGGDPTDVLDATRLMYRASRAVDGAQKMLKRDDLANIPMGWPCEGGITSPFGYRDHPVWHTWKHHNGIDIGAPYGAPVCATGGGTVTFTGWKWGYGRTVDIEHSPHLVTRYAHLSEITVRVGDVVKRGDWIGDIGTTGTVTGPHLHYEVRINGEPVDPAGWL
ncbi:MAG: M23 family metallopeptidase [Deltaproteobacteria bacterium]|nr:M23 family metallopeptidase [Candidatus Zymogenaceae bacterium]